MTTADSTYLPHCAGPCRCNAGTITDADGSVEHVQGEDCDCFPDDAGTACVHCATLSTHVSVYAWRRRSRTDEHAATITLARRTDGCDVCAGLGRPRTTTGRPCVYCGAPLDDLLLVVDSTEDRRRIREYRDGLEEVGPIDFEEVLVGDEHITPRELAEIEDVLRDGTPDGWDLERLWCEP